jgi:hypothetical protein
MVMAVCNCAIAQPGTPEVKKEKGTVEVGVNLFTLSIKRFNYGYMASNRINQYVMPGVYLRYQKSKHMLRLGANFLQSASSTEHPLHGGYDVYPQYGYYYASHTISRSAELKIGYQYLLSKKQVSPYVCVDAGGAYTREKGVSSSFGCFSNYQNRPFLIERITGKINPGVGLRWCIRNKVVLTYESGVDLFLGVEHDLLNGAYPRMSRGIRYSPIQQFSLGIKF